jgi:hypothetical protein
MGVAEDVTTLRIRRRIVMPVSWWQPIYTAIWKNWHSTWFEVLAEFLLRKQIKARPTRWNKWWFIGNQLFLNVFRASLRPSSGEQTACHCIWFPVLAMVVVVPESRVARCVHCSEAQCTHLATRLSKTTTIARTGNHRQWHAVCSPDDGRKDARNMLRNTLLRINHYLLRLVGLAFICCKLLSEPQNGWC